MSAKFHVTEPLANSENNPERRADIEIMTRSYRATSELGYWMCAALTCLASTLPFTPQRLLNAYPSIPFVIITAILFGSPILWFVALSNARRFATNAGRTSWWLWLTAPFALWTWLQGAAMVMVWMIFGFAP
jgi:hypothetical protein